jgi:ABC-type amino acid transport substrate-binding protein
VLDSIRARGQLRVGYLPNALPFAFFNEQRELVGYDIELAHQLANDLRRAAGTRAVDRAATDHDLARRLLRHHHVGRAGHDRPRE